MTATALPDGLKKQHVIDPEICIRCNTCEATCPVGAVTHNDANYVVDPEKCNYCMDCISPCPTGSIDNWRIVRADTAYSLDEQMEWTELPSQEDLGDGALAASLADASEVEIAALIEAAHGGAGGKAVPPASASKPAINLFTRSKPAIATIQGNFRITDPDTESDVRHIVLSFGETQFPVLEGQSIGIVPPVTNADGKELPIRLYSVASARDGEKRNANNVSLTVKRVPGGLVSEWLCNRKVGEKVFVTGPFGATFLMPNDANANLVMICTGTGSAPFRAFTERRRRAMEGAPGRAILFFGARTPGELPYFGPLQKVRDDVLAKHLVFSRVKGAQKEYVQDRMRAEARALGPLIGSPSTHIYICGLKGMEAGVDAALAEIASAHGLDWASLRPAMRGEGRYHVETY
jgi:benzoyl-CoA 2,3-dioxygenase component A